MNVKLLVVIMPPSIYHGFSTQKTLWEQKFRLGEFTPVNMKSCVCHNVKKQREINNG